MKAYFTNIVLFLFFFLVISEIIARLFHISSDAPRTFKNQQGYIRLQPNQEGYWNGGKHKWFVNSLGYPGKDLPSSYDNLYTIIGDSYIANFMNPDSCRQVNYLRAFNNERNFLELSMSGANLLDYLAYTKEVEHFKPAMNFLYVNTKDFKHSIKKENKISGGLEVDLSNNKIYYPKYQGSKVKDFIYNFKFAYFLYRKNLKLFSRNNGGTNNFNAKKDVITPKQEKDIEKLINFISENYDKNKIVFVCHPDLNNKVISLLQNKKLQTISLKLPNNNNWKLKDGHWSCYGHEYMAEQVSNYLVELDDPNTAMN